MPNKKKPVNFKIVITTYSLEEGTVTKEIAGWLPRDRFNSHVCHCGIISSKETVAKREERFIRVKHTLRTWSPEGVK